MGKVIGIVSGKGGVGKTIFSVNLASTLAKKGFSVLLIDTNVTSPNISFFVGSPIKRYTLTDVLSGECNINDSIYAYTKGNFSYMPSSLSINKLYKVSISKLKSIVDALKTQYDYVVLDGPANMDGEFLEVVRASDELAVIATPDIISVTDALRVLEFGRRHGRKIIGLIINKYEQKDYNLKVKDIELLAGDKLFGAIPRDENIKMSLVKRAPVCLLYPKTNSTFAFEQIACKIAGLPVPIKKKNLWDKICFWND
ncbi:MAG: hypothetical protein COW69_00170 [Candidatus Huberarchaeum crystalense]|uniref:CobQ/CobB/MinD/ParA nucleotide binding domain-containing protein n=1 Tax=Huberarchaeum crystalense TaxID=2014257 RepID=A0A2G9LJU0_HUBC1|nr:MAG: hypothetical protein COW69_00170 [Candidatus Huberarchaeum crystalense]PIV13949.1 MAG: hypothetical protein COS45_00135 [Candidatus Huberarchaeum crystalense]PJC01260.1 MAG: hypothetical protein CO072_01770 [Candidatus Huberarchaeum crystalense]